MAVIELTGSYEGTVSEQPTTKRKFRITNAATRDDATLQLAGSVSASDIYQGQTLFLQSLNVSEIIAANLWEGTATWGTFKQPESGDFSYQFDLTTESQHIEVAKEHIQTVCDAGHAAADFDHGGLIGVDQDGNVSGCDMMVPVATSQVQFMVAAVNITTAYKQTLLKAIATTNKTAWGAAEIGEFLLTGVAGKLSSRNPLVFDMVFKWGYKKNRTNVVVGTLPGVDVKGWQYLWVERTRVKGVAGKRMVMKPMAVHVERIFDESEYNDLGIGSGY